MENQPSIEQEIAQLEKQLSEKNASLGRELAPAAAGRRGPRDPPADVGHPGGHHAAPSRDGARRGPDARRIHLRYLPVRVGRNRCRAQGPNGPAEGRRALRSGSIEFLPPAALTKPPLPPSISRPAYPTNTLPGGFLIC